MWTCLYDGGGRKGAAGTLRFISLLAMPAAFAFAGSITYTVSVIPAPPGTNTVTMSGINDSGQVAGYGYIGSSSEAFVATTSGDTVIGPPDGTSPYSLAFAINSSGQIAGYFGSSTAVDPFVGSASESSAIPLPSGFSGNSNAFGINDSGEVAAYADGQAFIGATSGSTAIPLPDGFSSVGAFAINNSGQVAGYGSSGGSSQAYIGTTSGSTALPLPAGFTSARGYAINDSGQVAGFGTNSSNHSQAWIGTTSGATAIPLPTGATVATDTYGSLNSSGQVVGSSAVGGWIWDSTDGTELLNSLVPTGWTITSAISISDSALILAEGTNGSGSKYLELTPVSAPEPGTAGLIVAAGLCIPGLSRAIQGRDGRDASA